MLTPLPDTVGGYRGRFAPTPSGPLHFGSLVAALGSFLDARSAQGAWLVRMEDVDPPRVLPGAADAILRALERYGFEWDGPVMWQGQRSQAYQAALDVLMRAGHLFGCTCTRKHLAARSRPGVDGPVYPGTCRGQPAQAGRAWRFRVAETRMVFEDRLLGRVACNLATECGDFVLQRADGVFTYQLAVVVDDQAQGITHVVRGADLLPSTPRQMALQWALGFGTPVYAHLPVVLDGKGFKLSKQTLAAPLDLDSPVHALLQAGRFLGMALEPVGSLAEFWAQAREQWHRAVLPPLRSKRPTGSWAFSPPSCS